MFAYSQKLIFLCFKNIEGLLKSFKDLKIIYPKICIHYGKFIRQVKTILSNCHFSFVKSEFVKLSIRKNKTFDKNKKVPHLRKLVHTTCNFDQKIPASIPRIPTLISLFPTSIPHIPTNIIYFAFVLFPDFPSWLLQIVCLIRKFF